MNAIFKAQRCLTNIYHKQHLDNQWVILLFSSTSMDSTSIHKTLQVFSSSLSTCPTSAFLHIKQQILPYLDYLN